IESYLSSLGQSFVTDSTNLVPDAALRNRIRLQLLPLMNDIVPSATENIHRTTENMQQAVQVFDHAMESSSRECVSLQKDLVSINIETLQNQPSPEYTLFIILRDYGFNATQISQIYSNLQAPSGRRFDSSTHQLVFHRGTLLIAPLPKTQKPLRIPEPGTYVYGQDKRIKVSLQDFQPNDSLNFGNDAQRMTVVYDADEVSFPLIVRPIGQGDRFCPFGMNGTKLVSDYLTDRKRSLIERQRQLVVTDEEGNILCLVGERRAEGHRVTSETQKFLIVEFS
ncbi:MAG: tRNA(Ile)-lysidine synthetase, partial [Prevotella sp.]|nr:tRNA(Ile)-lysidine synthetase [Prevotella sp.]